MSKKNKISYTERGREVHYVLADIEHRINITIGLCNVAMSNDDMNQIRNKLIHLYNQGFRAGRSSLLSYRSKSVEQVIGNRIIETYPDMVSAAVAVEGIKQGISRAIKEHTRYKGYFWRFKQ